MELSFQEWSLVYVHFFSIAPGGFCVFDCHPQQGP